jgi:hypothetical protein
MQRSALAVAKATILGAALCCGQIALAQTQMQGRTGGAPPALKPGAPAQLPSPQTPKRSVQSAPLKVKAKVLRVET